MIHAARYNSLLIGLIILLLVSAIFAISVGRYYIEPVDVFGILFSPITGVQGDWNESMYTVVHHVRLPRVIAAILVGGGLALCGAVFQGLFRNPLVSSEVLGVSSGAGFGAAVAIITTENLVFVQMSAFVFGLIAMGMTYWISRVRGQTPLLMLILSGIVVGSLFSAMTSMCKYVADPLNKMPTIVFWLMGSLNHPTGSDIALLGPVIIVMMIILLLLRWRLNIMSLGDEDAQALGINTQRLKFILIVCTTFITAASVSMCGIIGWIGLVIPHIGRILIGPNNSRLLPITVLLGAVFLLLIDVIARTLTSAEIPIGLLTAAIGAPLFAVLIRVSRIGW